MQTHTRPSRGQEVLQWTSQQKLYPITAQVVRSSRKDMHKQRESTLQQNLKKINLHKKLEKGVINKIKELNHPLHKGNEWTSWTSNT